MSANVGQKLVMTGSTFAATWGLVQHGGEGAIIAAVLASVVFSNADTIVDKLTGGRKSPQPDDDDYPTEEEIAAYRAMQQQLGQGDSHRQDDLPTEEEIAEYRQMQALARQSKADRQSQIEGESDFAIPEVRKSNFTFSLLLSADWRPSQDQIYLAQLENGQDVFVSLRQLVHIALAGSTRQGKTSLIRQLLSQLIPLGCDCILLDPHYTPYDVEIDEDWTPFIPYLKVDPMEGKDFNRIEQILKYASSDLLNLRKAKRTASKPVGKDAFIFIDEYPAIIAEKPNVQGYIAKLLREGGKYHIHLVIASQDFQVKTAFPDVGGAIRDCFSTCLYVGGDKTTARVLLDTAIPTEREPMLGKGPIYLRCATCKAASLAFTPWTDNDAIYTLVGPGTYERDADTEELDEEELGNEWDANDNPIISNRSLTKRNPYPDEPSMEDQPEPQIVPNLPDTGRKAEGIDLNAAIAVYNTGATSRYQLAKIFGLSENQGRKLKELIEAQAKQDNG